MITLCLWTVGGTASWLRVFLYSEVFLNLTEVFLTLTEVFPCFFLSCKANSRVKLAKTGHGPHSSTLVVICVVQLLFVLFYVLFVCKCVLPSGENPIAVNKYIILYHSISYHIISYHIISYHIISYHMLRYQLQPAIRRKRLFSFFFFLSFYLSFWRVSAAWQRSTSSRPSYRDTDSGFKIGGVTPPAILARFGIRWFAPLLAPKKTVQVAVISCQMRRWSRRAWLPGTATKRLLLPTKLCPSGTLG